MLYTGFCWEREEKNHWGNTGLDEKIILKRISKKMLCGDMDWMELAAESDRWRALANAVVILRVP